MKLAINKYNDYTIKSLGLTHIHRQISQFVLNQPKVWLDQQWIHLYHLLLENQSHLILLQSHPNYK